MLGLLSLANELIGKIGDELDTPKGRTAFRSTCKQIDRTIAPQVLSYLVININEERAHLSISQLEALATRSTRAAEYVQTVDIDLLGRNYNRKPFADSYVFSKEDGLVLKDEPPKGPQVAWAYEKMKELLLPALSTLTATTTVNWEMSNRNPAWATIVISEFLANLPVLRALRLGGVRPDISGLQLHRVSNLTKLVVDGPNHKTLPISEIIGNSPNLTHLEIRTYSSIKAYTPTLHGLLSMVPHDRPLRLRYLGMSGCFIRLDQETLPHLRVLKSFDIPHPRSRIAHGSGVTEEIIAKIGRFSSSPTEVWKALGRAGIHIQDITAAVDEGLLEYLESAIGVEKLTLVRADSDPLAHKFFAHVLPRLSPTLTSLYISAPFEGLWCFGEHSKDALLACARLETLSLAVDPNKLYHTGEMVPKHVVADLLEVTSELPQRLSQLQIFSAGLERDRNAICGPSHNRLLRHRKYSVHKLSSLVENFEPVNPTLHPQTILVDENRFHLKQCDADSGVWRYVKDTPNNFEVVPVESGSDTPPFIQIDLPDHGFQV